MCTRKRVTLVEKEKLDQYTIRQHHKYHTVCLSYCSCCRDKNTLTKPPNGGRICFSSQFQGAVMVGNQGYRVSKQLDAQSGNSVLVFTSLSLSYTVHAPYSRNGSKYNSKRSFHINQHNQYSSPEAYTRDPFSW